MYRLDKAGLSPCASRPAALWTTHVSFRHGVFLSINPSSPVIGQVLRLPIGHPPWMSPLSTSPTSGSKLLGGDPARSVGSSQKEGLGTEFAAVVTEDQIEAETTYQTGTVLHRQRISINRYTGRIENLVIIGKRELVHHGLCRQLLGRMF
jgi:hypothetical protein